MKSDNRNSGQDLTELLFGELFQKTSDAVLIIRHRIFVDCNQATVNMLGYQDKSEFLNTHPSKLSPDTQADGRDSVEKADAMMSLAQHNGNHRFEWNHLRANGDIFPVEVLLTAISQDAENETFVVVWRDVTKRKQAQKLNQTISALTQELNALMKLDEMGRAVAASMRTFFRSDAISINYINHIAGINRGLYTEDTPDGEAQPIEYEPLSTSFEKLDTESIQGSLDAKLLNRSKKAIQQKFLDRPFGEVDRKSASLMFAPIAWDNIKIGEVTVQSYTLNKYSEQDLDDLQVFCSQIGAAFLRADSLYKLEHEHQELLRTKAHLQLIEQLAHVGSWERDLSNNSVYWSDELYRVFQIDPSKKVKLKDLLPIIHPEDVKRFEQEVRDHVPVRSDYRILLPGGQLRYIHEEIRTSMGEDDKPVQLSGCAQDITPLVEAQEELRLSEAKYRTLVETSPDFIYQVDHLGRILSVNHAAAKVMGTKPQELEGKKVADLFPPTVAEIYQHSLEKTFTTGERAFYESSMNVGGREIWMNTSLNPILDDAGNVIAVFGVSRDITKSKLAEKARSASDEKYRLIVENAHDGFEITQNDHIIFANARFAEMLGYTVDELKDIHFEKLFSEQGRRDLYKRMEQRKIDAAAHAEYETSFYKKDGDLIDVHVKYEIIEYHDQPATFAVIQDITDLKRQEEIRIILENKLRQSQKLNAIGTMINGFAHEINNILQSTFLYGGILKDQLPPDEEMHKTLKVILDGSKRSRKIISQIMAFSRQSESRIKPYNLQRIVPEIIAQQKAAIERRVACTEDYTPSEGLVNCDRDQLERIIGNLCDNALDATPEGGKISISVKEILEPDTAKPGEHEVQANAYQELLISDTGAGMDQETLEKVFDPFFTTKEVGQGTGLGLSVVHGLVEQIGGTISASSTIGEGSTFRILFPVLKGNNK